MNNDTNHTFRIRKIIPIRVHTGQINFKANRTARMELSNQAFALYNCFITVYGSEWIIASREKVCQEANLSAHLYYKSFSELVDKKYLVPVSNVDYRYDSKYDTYFCYEDPEDSVVKKSY